MYVVLYQNLLRDASKVSQIGYTTLEEARAFCRKRVGSDKDAVIVSRNGHVFLNSVTSDRYTIEEVRV